MKLELKIYRHKYRKDIFLAKNWSLCGGGAESDFFYATTDMLTAIKDANREGFTHWMRHFLDDEGRTKLRACIVDTKDVDFDGYKGKISKKLSFDVADFECITLAEVSE